MTRGSGPRLGAAHAPAGVRCEAVTVDACGEVIARQVPAATRRAEPLGDGVSLELVWVPGGDFTMGSPDGEGYADEHPAHRVSVPGFWLGRYPVTQAEWAAVMEWSPPYRCTGPRRPVDRVSWRDAVAFCARLAQRTGRPYRLPGEAEWEYACRAGTTTPFACGATITIDLANYVGLHRYRAEPPGIYRHVTTTVGSFPPNAFGLHDMHGNVWEWCADTWHATYAGAPDDGSAWEGAGARYRVLRGGCWHDPPDLCRSAARLKADPRDGEDYVGLRVALDAKAGGTSARSAPGSWLAGAVRRRREAAQRKGRPRSTPAR